MNISTRTKITKVKAAESANTGAVNSDCVDMQGFDGVMFFTAIGTANAGNYMNAAQGALSNGSDAADLEDTKVVAAADGQVVWIDVYKPTDRYVRAEVARGASTTVGDIYALQYGPRVLPCDNLVDDTIIGELHISPAEGTA